MLIAFFLSPFVIHHLGTSAYGVWLLANSITGYFGLLDLGVGKSVTYYIARFHTQGEHEKSSRLVSTALAVFSVLGAVALGASVVIASVAPRLFHVPESFKANFHVLVILGGATVASCLVTNVFSAILVGLQRFESMNAIEIGMGILRATSILFALGEGKGLITLAIIHLVSYAIMGLIYAWTAWRLYPQLRIRFILSDRANTRLIFSFGSHLFLLSVSSYLILYADALVIGAFLPIAMITFFAIAGNLIAYSRSLVNGISNIVSPLASSLDADGNHDQIARLAVDGPRYATMLVLPIVITLALRGKTFIGLWMGPEYAGLSGEVLQVLSLALFFSAANQVATSMIWGINRHRPLVLVYIAEGLLNLMFSIGLIHKMGIVGVAWGTVIPTVATSLLFWPIYTQKILGIDSSKYILSTWVRPAIVAAPFALMSLTIDRIWYPKTLWLFFFQVALTLPVAILSFWFGCFSRTERRSHVGQIVSRTIRVEEPA